MVISIGAGVAISGVCRQTFGTSKCDSLLLVGFECITLGFAVKNVGDPQEAIFCYVWDLPSKFMGASKRDLGFAVKISGDLQTRFRICRQHF